MFIKQRRSVPKILGVILSALGILVFTVFMAAILVEWLVGCGESYIDAQGVRHQNDCVFISIK
jgi:hypothetical protein